MQKFPRLLVCLWIVAVGLPDMILASDAQPWVDAPFAVDAKTLNETSRALPVPDGASVLVLYRDGSYEFDADGRGTYREYMLYRLLTPQAIDGWSEVSVSYAPWHQERPRIRARVVTADGNELRLDERAVIEQKMPGDSPGITTDRVLLKASLPVLRVGALVEEEVVVRDLEPFFAAGITGSYPLRMRAPIHRGRFRLSAPTSVPLRFGVRLMDELKPRQRLSDGHVELTFEYRDLSALEAAEPGLPSHQPRAAQINFSTGESWRAVASGYERLVDEKISEAELPELTEFSEQELTEILAELHNEVRYSGIELGAKSLIPAAPGVTLQRGFGDCKDQATLLVALLRQQNLPAHVALLNAGFGQDVEPGLPGISRFNHAVVYVASTPPVWIDPTDPAARVGELPASDQNRWALIVDSETHKLLRTPTANSIDNITVEYRDMYLADHGPGRVVERSVYLGEQERQQRRVARVSSDESRREGYWEYLESTYLVEELGEIEESDPEDLSEPFTLKLEGLNSSRAMTDLSESVVAIRQESLVASLPLALQSGFGARQNPFVIEQPFITEWHYRIIPPVGFVAREVPKNEERLFGLARYSRTFRIDEQGALIADLRFDSGPRHLTASRFEEMRRGVRSLLDEEPILLWFDHAGAAGLAEGRGPEAIAEFRRLAELEPGKAIHRIRLAQALLGVGLGREAQRQAELAVEAEPTMALAQWCLGFALEHDELGRRFNSGFDRPRALAALEQAIQLEPDSPLPRTELAILLEYDDQGSRYSEGADLDRAIVEYRILTKDLGAKNLQVNLVSALYWARRWDELYAATLRYHESPVSRYLHLVSLAILRGPEVAIQESWSMSSSPEEQLSLLNSAAQHLVIARHYSAAAALLKRAARDAANPEGILNRAAILAQARSHEDLKVKTGSPDELAKSLLQLLGQRDYDRGKFAELFHPQYLLDRGQGESALESTLNRLRQEQFRSVGDLPVEAVLDLALVILKTETDGDRDRGYRVRLLNQMAGGKLAFRVYVTVFEGRLVIAAIEDEYGQLAKEAGRRLDAGDLKGAHQWLDWAREALPTIRAEDPYGFRPFSRFWTRGTGAFRDKMRLATAILMANQPEAEEALPALEEALLQSSDEDQRRILKVALFMAYSILEREDRLGALSADLLEEEPSSTLAFLGRCQQLLGDNLLEELDLLAEERLSLLPDNPEALRYLVRSAARDSDLERAFGYFEQLRAAGELRPSDENLWSWLLLFLDPIPETVLDLAQNGATTSQYRDRPMLHTLSAVYAELGRSSQAYQVLVQSLELRENSEPKSDDWYVYGRIVEEYGFTDLAREYYGRVEPAEKGEVYTARDLVAKRLRQIASGGKKRKGS